MSCQEREESERAAAGCEEGDKGAPAQAKRRRVHEGEGGQDSEMLGSDSDSDGEAGDLAADGDWEEFDAMPAQNVDVRGTLAAAFCSRGSWLRAKAVRFW